MPKKTKESKNKKENILSNLLSKKITSKVSKTKESILEKKDSKPVPTSPKNNQKKSTSSKSSTASKSSTKKASPSKNTGLTKKNSSPNSIGTKKTSGSLKVKAEKTSTTKQREIPVYSPEYYDLPFRYNQTVVKILAQTPTNLFIYWDISDKDRDNLKKQYGKYFFEITKPVLIVHNETMNYSFEIDIDDFANSWYLHVNDSNCQYKIELGRRPIPINYSYMPNYDEQKEGPIKPIQTPYIYISSSNRLEAPNDKVLFNNTNKITFRNIKTNTITQKDISEFPFINNDNQFVSIYELYKKLFKDELSNNTFDFKSPSSGNPSSGSFSSRFK